MKVKSLSRVRLFATLWTVDYQSPSSMEFSRQEQWSGLQVSSPGDLPDTEIEFTSPAYPVLAGGFFTTSATWEAQLALIGLKSIQFSSFQVLTRVLLFVTPWTAARQASLSITNAQSLLKLMSITSVMAYNDLSPLPSSSLPAFNLFQHQGLFK